MNLVEGDYELIEIAKQTGDRLHVKDLHEVTAALRTRSGTVFSGIHIEGTVGSIDVCGEVAAICSMVSAGQRDIETIVAIYVDGQGNYSIMSPCGRCRELISDFNLDANVIVGSVQKPIKIAISELLPMKSKSGAA